MLKMKLELALSAKSSQKKAKLATLFTINSKNCCCRAKYQIPDDEPKRGQ